MRIKKFDDYINEYGLGFNKDGEPYGFDDASGETPEEPYGEDNRGDRGDTFDVTRLSSLQAKKLLDFLESDIRAISADDMDYYEEMTGFYADRLGELYIGYGYNGHKWTETKKLIAAYEKAHKKTWKQVSDEADEAE